MDIHGSMIVFPEEHDPDSFVRKEGVEAVHEAITKKKPVLDYYFEYCINKHSIKTPEGKGFFIKAVLPHIDQHRRDGIHRTGLGVVLDGAERARPSRHVRCDLPTVADSSVARPPSSSSVHSSASGSPSGCLLPPGRTLLVALQAGVDRAHLPDGSQRQTLTNYWEEIGTARAGRAPRS